MSNVSSADSGATLAAQLTQWVHDTYGERCDVAAVGSLGGHSGITIGFDVVDRNTVVERLVLKMPPSGVARKNNFDVLRQVPLLQTLETHQIAAPRARYWSDDESYFGAPFLMMSRLAGRSPPDLFRDEARNGVANVETLFDQAVDVLVMLHTIDTCNALTDWNEYRDADAEIEHWVRILHKTSDENWLATGLRVAELLRETKPAVIPIGIAHGDYYSNNWVFDKDTLSGVVDWEGTTVGPCLIDLGWLYMMYEPASWGPTRRRTMHWQPDPERFVARYSRASTFDLTSLPWYRALAAFRIASITAYYYEEHVSGRRVNDAWELFAEAFPFLLRQAGTLLLKLR